MPHTLVYALLLQSRFDNLNELPKDKRPPRGLFDKPFQLEDYLDNMYKPDHEKDTEFIEFNFEEAE